MLNTGTASTFQQYFDTVFSSYITTQLQTAQQIDVVFDTYIQNSLKSTTRQKRGKGVRRRVASTTVMPKNWKDFLQVDENKTELFRFLSQEVFRLPTEEGKTIYSTIGIEVLCSLAAADVSSMAPCSHEEADTRLFVHLADAVRKGFQKVMVRTVDTDVVVQQLQCLTKLVLMNSGLHLKLDQTSGTYLFMMLLLGWIPEFVQLSLSSMH